MIRACKRCCYGVEAKDPDGNPFMGCGLKPPVPMVVPASDGPPQLVWLRPPMMMNGWCGQFRLSIWRLLRGTRA